MPNNLQRVPTTIAARYQFAAKPKELTVADILSIFVRRRVAVIAVVALTISAAVALCCVTTRQYLATAELQIQPEASSQLRLDTSSTVEPSDALQDNINLQTQASILESDSLALSVVRDLHLTDNAEFRTHTGILSNLFGGPGRLADAAQAAPADDGMTPRQRTRVLDLFHKKLTVKAVPGTRLITVSFLSADPQLAAHVVNKLTAGLEDFNFATRRDATARTAQYLMNQLSELRQQSEDLEAKVAAAQRESGIVSLGGVDGQGRQQVYSAVLDKLQQATTAYSQAQSNLIAKQAVYEAAETGDPEALSSLSGSSLFAGVSGSNPLALVQDLRLQQSNLEGQFAELSAKFGSRYPKLEEMRGHLNALDQAIKAEVSRIQERAKTDLSVARNVEQNTRGVYLGLKSQADALNNKAITFTILQEEADQSRTLYNTLFKQLKEAGIVEDFRASNISVVDPARVPSTPAKPQITLYIAGALGVGFLLGGCCALLLDAADSTVQTVAELGGALGWVPIGVIPFLSARKAIKRPLDVACAVPDVVAALAQPRSPYTEALRALRTSLVLPDSASQPQVILITSSVPGEGKTMLSINLAALLAKQEPGKKVLLVEADLRRPALANLLQFSPREGLAGLLENGGDPRSAHDTVLAIPGVDGLYALAAGHAPEEPAELLGSERMKEAICAWREQYAYIVIDGAPVLPVTDSVVLSTKVDMTLVVARHKITKRQFLQRTRETLTAAGAPRVHLVVNALQDPERSYYGIYKSGYSSAGTNSLAKTAARAAGSGK